MTGVFFLGICIIYPNGLFNSSCFQVGPWAEDFLSVFGCSVECMHSYSPFSCWYVLECSCYCTFFEVQYFMSAIVVWMSLTVFFLGRCSKYYVVTSCIQLKADLSLKDIGNMINKVVQGWINYYTHYYKSEFYEVLRYINQCLIKWVRRSYKKKNTRSLFYCLNRRSQKKSYNWGEFLNMLDNSYPLVRPRIYVNIYE